MLKLIAGKTIQVKVDHSIFAILMGINLKYIVGTCKRDWMLFD